MPFEDPWLRDGKSSPIEWHQQMFAQTRNVIHVWRTIQICTELLSVRACDAYPDWVYEYLGRVADGVEEMYRKYSDNELNLATDVASVTGFKQSGQGRRSHVFSEMDLQSRNQSLAIKVKRALREDSGLTVSEACSRVSEDHACAAVKFEANMEAGRVSADVTPFESETPVSEEVVHNAWNEWSKFLDRV